MTDNKFFTTFSLGLLSLGLLCCTFSGCVRLSQQECHDADWETLGFKDGSIGLFPSFIKIYRANCAKYDIAPDEEAYKTGHTRGIKEYCTQNNGFKIGTLRQPYDGVCPADLEPAFLEGYYQGWELSGGDGDDGY